MDNRYFSFKLVEWYQDNHRNLPWRQTRDPYFIWLSEIILQQTRVSQGLPYYQNFVKTFPTVFHLARAKEQDILRLWQGLGYYTRARNLHKCARLIAATYNGNFPQTYESLKKLPGIGDYTAAAIASFCFNEKVAVIDGNVYRVLSRVFGIDEDIAKPSGKKAFTGLANNLLGNASPGLYNQAIMEFGALQCTPGQPSCTTCIFDSGCIAARDGLQQLLPVKGRIKPVKRRYFYYFVFCSGSEIAMKKRTGKDIWQGLFDFYLVEKTRPKKIEAILETDDLLKKMAHKAVSMQVTNIYRHILSHQTILAKFITLDLGKIPNKIPGEGRFYSKKRVNALPKPVLISKFLEDLKIL